MILAERLRAACAAAGVDDLASLLVRLRFRPDDVAGTLAAARLVGADAAASARVEELCARLVERGDALVGESTFPAADCARTPERGIGVLALLAFLATLPEAIERRRARGMSVGDALDAFGDLGQQVWVHRRVHGDFGLTNECWLNVNWAGGLVWLGRLQYSVERVRPPYGDDHLAFFCHIPETGALDPGEVDSSLALARERLPRWYPEVTDPDLYCVSWLLDPAVLTSVDRGSNIAAFARRFRDLAPVQDGDRDAVYFTFRREPPVTLADLPQGTRLERGVVRHLSSGGHYRLFAGKIAL